MQYLMLLNEETDDIVNYLGLNFHATFTNASKKHYNITSESLMAL